MYPMYPMYPFPLKRTASSTPPHKLKRTASSTPPHKLKRTASSTPPHKLKRTASSTPPHKLHSPLNQALEPDLYGINVAKAWLEKCSRHKICNESSIGSALSDWAVQLPSRLLDISVVGSKAVRLVDTDGLKAEDCQYVALSHCWGETIKMKKTTTENIKQHYDSIRWADLSKTFQHAVIVTQRLGLSYLWIDSLCIIQGDQADFEKECARMHIIYLNCYCMIAANDAKSTDDGFLEFWEDLDAIDRSEIPQYQQAVKPKPALCPREASKIRGHLSGGFNNLQWSRTLLGPLSTRGWACQERQLAPRILHYTKLGILWECRFCFGSGDSKVLIHRKMVYAAGLCHSYRDTDDADYHSSVYQIFRIGDKLSPYARSYRYHLDQSFLDESDSAYLLRSTMSQWRDLVEEYSKKSLTFSEDRLPALSGIAAIIAGSVTNVSVGGAGQYLAGIWLADFHRQLLWCPIISLNADDVETSQALSHLPSWSWISCAGPVIFQIKRYFALSDGGFEQLYGGENRNSVSSYSGLRPIPTTEYVSSDLIPRGLDKHGRVDGSTLIISGRYLEYKNLVFVLCSPNSEVVSRLIPRVLVPPQSIRHLWNVLGTRLPYIYVIFDERVPPQHCGTTLRFLYIMNDNDLYAGTNFINCKYGLVLQKNEERTFRRIGVFCQNCKDFSTFPKEIMRLV